MFKKVGSWFGFGGANQIVSPDQRLVGVRVSPHADGGAHLWLLKTDSLQIWYFDNQSRESLVFEKNIVAEFESHIYETQEQQYGGRIPLDLTVVDFHIQSADHHNPGRVCLLIGAVPAETEDENILQLLDQRGDHGEYHLAVYEASFSSNLPITAAGSASIQLISTLYIPEEVAASSEYPMLMVPPDEPVVYIHWEHFAISIPIPNPSEVPVDIIDITGNPSYRIFGSSSLSNATLYFTPNHGIVKFKILPSTLASILGESHPDRKSSKVSSSHAVGFMSQASAEDIISEAFHRYMTQPSSQHLSSPSASYPWSPLIDMVWNLNYSDAVKSFSQRIADSSPTEDPRWPEFAGIDASSNLGHQGQLQSFLHRQIEEKQQTLENFVQFLGEVGIWSELPLAIRDSIEQTAERLAGASLLRSHHNDLIITMQRQHGSSLAVTPRTASANHLVIFNQSIEAALNSRGISRTQWERDGLGAQDIFYAQVSKIETILEPALAVLKAQLAQKLSQESQFTLISQANFLFESVVVAAQAYRLAHSQEYCPSSNPDGEVYPSDYLRAFAGRSDSNLTAPWTFAFQSTIREMARITRQFVEQVKQSKAAASQKTLGKGFASSTDVDVELLDEQLFRLSDAILADLHQEIVRSEGESGVEEMKAQFATIRVECIAPFKTDPSQYEQALHLAEKYQDFAALIEICQATNDDRRLWRYAEQFKEDRFEIVVFEHFFVNKQYHKLLTPPHIYWNSLTEYLNDTPQANFLSWVHQIQTGDFGSAERTFDLLAQTELHSTFKQRTLLSLAKISHFAQKPESGEVPALSNMVLESVEARQQKLYQINAQTLIRAILDSTDEDSPPLPSSALVKRLLDVAHGTEHLEPGSSLQLALDLYRNTTLLRSEFGNRDMLKNIWNRVLSLEHWNELADMLQRGQMDDDTLRDEIERSIFFRTAYATQSIEDELPSALFIEVVKSFQYNAATRRTLSTALSLVYEARGLPLPNLSELIHSSDEPQQQQSQDEVVIIEDSDEGQEDLAQGIPAEIGTMDQS
jgi:nuclear pore complex protein Nup133